MQQHDTPDTLHFVDPPYVFGTRSLRNVVQGCYRHEMTDEQHMELLDLLKNLQGMVVLSNYPSDLYERELGGWQVHTTGSRISAGRGTAVKTEVLWLNSACQQRVTAPPAVQQALEIQLEQTTPQPAAAGFKTNSCLTRDLATQDTDLTNRLAAL